MIDVEGYRIIEKIWENRNSSVFRGVRSKDETPVVLKWLYCDDRAISKALSSLKNELEIMELVAADNVLKAYEVLETRDGCGLVVEDFGGTSLREIMAKGKLALTEFLKIGISLTDSLGRVHQKDVIHKDINPGNLIVNSQDWTVKLSDFGISTLLSREEQSIIAPGRLEGTLAYISPEQTGRMNRAIDYRTDIYSLGVTFYELLCGKLPFQAKDAIGWVNNHIAVSPASPHEVNSDVPEVLSQIVMKMIEKNAEDRYQSAQGVKADLEKCLLGLEHQNKLETFSLGLDDASGRFHIPQKLYGREKEIGILLSHFDSSVELGTSEMMLVAGFSGIGKSALVKEIHKPIVLRRGYFISGKYDQFKRNIPFSAISQAFEELVYQLVSETEEELKDWKEKLLGALGANGQVIVDMIPELEVIIGKQAPAVELGPAEALARFNVTFQKFIKVFTQKEHPLVMFLDDLQWADSASLNFISMLMSDPDSRYLFLIGAYRDNEVSRTHPFMMMMDNLKKGSQEINTVSLTPLDEIHVVELVADSLQTNSQEAEPLAKLVMEKTEGNPFFVSEFLKTLTQEELIRFDFDRRKWVFNEGEIKAKDITNNVVELMVGRMQKLPEATQKLLQLAACIGNTFDLKTLSLVGETSVLETTRALWPAIQAGMLIPTGETAALLKSKDQLEAGISTTRALKATDKFLHDRVQQAAYAMIDEGEKEIIHLKIGRLLLANLKDEELDEKLFEVVRQFNDSLALIEASEEKLKISQLNLKVAKRAKDSTAYKSALTYIETGMKLLSEDSWKTQYELTLELFTEAADAAYLTTELELMQEYGAVVLARARTLMDKVRIYEIQIISSVNRYELREALVIAVDILGKLGVKLPKKPKLPHVLLSLVKTKLMLRGKNSETLLNLPPMDNPEKKAAMRILAMAMSPAYWTDQFLLPLIVFNMVQLTVKFGNAPASTFGYVLFGGAALCGQLSDFDGGFEFGNLALKLAERPENKEYQTKTLGLANFFIGQNKKPLSECIPPMIEGFQVGQEIGDTEWASHCGLWSTIFVFLSEDLQKAEEMAEFYGHAIELFKQNTSLNYLRMHQQVIKDLRGDRPAEPSVIKGGLYDEDIMEPMHWEKNDNTAIGFLYYNKLYLAYLFEEYEQAGKYADKTETCLEAGLLALIEVPYYYCYDSLIRLALYVDASKSERKKTLKKVAANQKKVKHWVAHIPETYIHKYDLIQAELARVTGRDYEAIALYVKAISGAIENGFIMEEALANELFAKFWRSKENHDYTIIHMTEARRLYQRWGAVSKVQDLELKYSELVNRDGAGAGRNTNLGARNSTAPYATTSVTTTTGVSSSRGAIDLGTVVKATRTMAGEIKLNRLLATMMEIVMENAGARRGFLFLERDGELTLAARNDMEQEKHETHISLPLSELEKEGNELAVSVVRYAARTKESVVISDAGNDEKFSRDPYVESRQPRSILCSPIINQGRLTGLLYLENNLSVGAFTPQRLEVLNMLSSQAAVSLENAVLYDNMETKVEDRTKEVKDILTNVNQGIFTINSDGHLTGGYSGMVPKIFEGIELKRAGAVQMEELAQTPKLNDYLDMLFTSPFISQKLIENSNPLQMYDYHYTNAAGGPAIKKISFSFSRIFETDDEGKETGKVQKLMVAVDDKTEEYELKKELEQKAEEQAGKVEKLYQILQLEPSVFSNFISESSATLDEVSTRLQELQDEPEANRELLRVIFREVHTLKGNARALSLDSIGKTAHELEDIFEELKENPERITAELKDKTHGAVSMLKAEIQDGNSLFEKILNMQQSLQSKPQEKMEEFGDRFRKIVEMESKESGKAVDFEFVNELKEPLEDQLLLKLRNPLSHIIRNSVSHGIEAGVRRKELEKSKKGQIKLSVSRKDGAVVLICEDDGGGLDASKIRKKAEQMQLHSAAELAQMNDKDVFRLIFSSGLSTRDSVSESAGRGVGMDAVKEDLKSLNALISIGTKLNQYTKFTIQIPEGGPLAGAGVKESP